MAEIFEFKKIKNFDKLEYLTNKLLKKYQLYIRKLMDLLKRNNGKNEKGK
jgi:hypothetical protein